jgi:polyadenylate-binding protein
LSRKSNKEPDSEANIFVKNLPQEMDQNAFKRLFDEFGTILSTKLEVDTTGESKCFGYIQFENHASA